MRGASLCRDRAVLATLGRDQFQRAGEGTLEVFDLLPRDTAGVGESRQDTRLALQQTTRTSHLLVVPLNPSSSLAKLLKAPVRPGRVTWLGLRPERRAPVEVLETFRLETGRGVSGDRYSRLDGNRQATLIGAENLAAIGAFLGGGPTDPEAVRRNVVVQGLNLLALKERRFRIGDAILETSGECHPCSRMEEVLGVGGYNAMRGRGGITARVLHGGAVRIGDAVERFEGELPA